MKKTIFMAILALFIAGCEKKQSTTDNNVIDFQSATETFVPYKTGDKITLKSVANSEITLVRTEKGFSIDGSDKILMIDVFGTYCEPCKDEAPHLMDFQVKNADKFMLVGLIFFENITNQEVIDNFSKKHNAYYFIANSKENGRIVEQILKDINYRYALQIPFKVMYKNGIYQMLTDTIEHDPNGKPYYLGKISTSVVEQDFLRIKNAN